MLDFVRALHRTFQQRMASSTPRPSNRGAALETVHTTQKPATPAPLSRKLGAAILSVSALLTSGTLVAADAAGTVPTDFNISASQLSEALSKFGAQTGMQVVYSPELVRGLKAPAVSGRHSADAALKQLLAGTGLSWSYVNGDTVVVKRADNPDPGTVNTTTAKKNSNASSPATELEEITVFAKIPEVLVVGSKILNADIRRTEDDPQPYVVFDRIQIERSNSSNVEEFLKTRLPMSAVQSTNSQLAGNSWGSQSSVNLRGLGENQTLILVDGRRMPGVNRLGTFGQPDINGVPLSMIERIEVLPATASGIYGGGATGGVVNIITRRASGVDIGVNYEDSFDTDASSGRADATAGFSVNEGQTQITIATSYSASNALLTGERDLAAGGRALQLRNNPEAFLTAPPPGYTSNICSAASTSALTCSSNPLVLDSGTPLGSNHTFLPPGYAGPASDGGVALLANAGRYNLELPDTVQGGRSSLLNDPSMKSAALGVRHTFTSTVDAFVDVFWTENRGNFAWGGNNFPRTVALAANATNNPFNTPILVSFPAVGLESTIESTSETIRAAGGAIVRLPRNWTAGIDYVWSSAELLVPRTDPLIGDPDGAGPGLSASQAFQNGTLDVMRDTNVYQLDYSPYLLPSPNARIDTDTTMKDATLRLSGPVFRLAGGAVTVSAHLGRREERAAESYRPQMNSNAVTTVSFFPSRSQTIESYYLETRAPLISASNASRFVRALELQASVRRDEYKTESPDPQVLTLATPDSSPPAHGYESNEVAATKFTAGLRYQPIVDVALRASYGTGFLPPSINQIVPTSRTFSQDIFDPKRGGTRTRVTYDEVSGGSPNLAPEESKSWSVGAIFTPRFLPDLRLSVDYVRIEKTDEIGTLSDQQMVDFEDLFPGRVTRAPLEPSAPSGYTAGVITGIDHSLVNLASSRLSAYDVQLDYTWRTAYAGEFQFFAVGTYQPYYKSQATPTAPILDSVGYTSGQLEWRGNAGLTWSRGPLAAGWSAQYFDSYLAYAASHAPAIIALVLQNQGSAIIPSQTYHDIFAKYRFESAFASGNARNLLDNLEITVGIQNVFNERPPILATTNPFGGYSTYGDPRLRRFSLTVRKTF